VCFSLTLGTRFRQIASDNLPKHGSDFVVEFSSQLILFCNDENLGIDTRF